jgi:CRP/FNR family transcriptional regulator, cyclic AMP receptor protein
MLRLGSDSDIRRPDRPATKRTEPGLTFDATDQAGRVIPQTCRRRAVEGGHAPLPRRIFTNLCNSGRPQPCHLEGCGVWLLHALSAEGDMTSKPGGDSFDPQAFLAKVGAGKTISSYHRDQIIFSQGDPADTVFYIQKGRIKVVVISDQGKEAVVGILEAGQFFGEGCLNGHALRIATTTAMEECLLTAIAKTTMIAMLHEEPKFSELFVAYLLTRNSRIEEDLIDQLFNSSEKRLARLLLLLANFGKEANPTLISPNISQETLAEMIGTTRSRVSFFMNKFRKLGLISYNGKIEVHRSLLNAVLREKPSIEQNETTDPN